VNLYFSQQRCCIFVLFVVYLTVAQESVQLFAFHLPILCRSGVKAHGWSSRYVYRRRQAASQGRNELVRFLVYTKSEILRHQRCAWISSKISRRDWKKEKPGKAGLLCSRSSVLCC
jgi:hypothetical protein